MTWLSHRAGALEPRSSAKCRVATMGARWIGLGQPRRHLGRGHVDMDDVDTASTEQGPGHPGHRRCRDMVDLPVELRSHPLRVPADHAT